MICLPEIGDTYAKIILAYNFTPERLQALKLICMMLRTQLRAVTHEELLQPVGYLAGLPEVASVSEAYSGDEGQEEMLLMCGFSRQDLDRLLAAIKGQAASGGAEGDADTHQLHLERPAAFAGA